MVPQLNQKKYHKLNHQRIVYIAEKQIKSAFKTIEIHGDDFHHLLNVLRLKIDDRVVCRSYRGLDYFCSIRKIKERVAFLHIDEIKYRNVENGIQNAIGVFLCIPRPQVLASIVAKLTEVGVDFLQLVFSERSFFKNLRQLNLLRYQNIMQQALKQSTAATPLEIKKPVALREIKNDFNFFSKNQFLNAKQKSIAENSINEFSLAKINKILLWECEAHNSLSAIDYTSVNKRNFIYLFVGPEGGISHLEKEHLTSLGFQSKSISANILKVETALLLALGKLL